MIDNTGSPLTAKKKPTYSNATVNGKLTNRKFRKDIRQDDKSTKGDKKEGKSKKPPKRNDIKQLKSMARPNTYVYPKHDDSTDTGNLEVELWERMKSKMKHITENRN